MMFFEIVGILILIILLLILALFFYSFFWTLYSSSGKKKYPKYHNLLSKEGIIKTSIIFWKDALNNASKELEEESIEKDDKLLSKTKGWYDKMKEAYSFINSEGNTYYLHAKEIELSRWRKKQIYYFVKSIEKGACDIPQGKVVHENTKTKLPFLVDTFKPPNINSSSINHISNFEKIKEYIDLKKTFISETKAFIKKLSEQQKQVKNKTELKDFLKEIEFQKLELRLAQKEIEKWETEKLFHYANISFKLNYFQALEKLHLYIDDLDEDEDGSYTIWENPYTGDEIINSLFPGKYIAMSYYVYHGLFDFEGEEAEDIAEYNDGNDSIYYVGGAYDEDRSKEVNVDIFMDLENEGVIEQNAKYQALEFIENKNYKSLRDYHKKELQEMKANSGPYDLPNWVKNPYRIMKEYNLDTKLNIELAGPKDDKIIGIFYKLIGTEVFMYNYIFNNEEEIKKKILFNSFNFLQSLIYQGYDKFDLPEYLHQKDEFHTDGNLIFGKGNNLHTKWGNVSTLHSKDDNYDKFEALAKKYKKSAASLRWYTAFKNYLLPSYQDFIIDHNSKGIANMKNGLKWFRENNISLYKIIVHKLYSTGKSSVGHTIPCLWEIYPNIIHKDYLDIMYLTETELQNTSNLKTKEFDSLELYTNYVASKKPENKT